MIGIMTIIDNQPYRLQDMLLGISQHAMKHMEEFKNPVLGKPVLIRDQRDLYRHVVGTLFHTETKSFSGQDKRDFFYNSSTNTLIVINPAKDKKGNFFGGTVYRPDEKIKDFIICMNWKQDL